jgi:glutathione S-transferase
MTFGQIEADKQEYDFVYTNLKEKLALLNNQLNDKDWLCGTPYPTIVDIQLAIAQIEMQKSILDQKQRTSLNCVASHYKKVIDLPDVQNRIGAPLPGKLQILPVFSG